MWSVNVLPVVMLSPALSVCLRIEIGLTEGVAVRDEVVGEPLGLSDSGSVSV